MSSFGVTERRADETPNVGYPTDVRHAPPPGEESVGPAMVSLVQELRRVTEIAASLQRQAQIDKQRRCDVDVSISFETDASGHAAVRLFTVPGGATAYLMRLGVEAAGRSPASAALAGNPFAFIASDQPSALGGALPVGGQLFVMPDGAVSAQPLVIPATYHWDHPAAAPALRGPRSFYYVQTGVAALASLQMVVTFNLEIDQPDT